MREGRSEKGAEDQRGAGDDEHDHDDALGGVGLEEAGAEHAGAHAHQHAGQQDERLPGGLQGDDAPAGIQDDAEDVL